MLDPLLLILSLFTYMPSHLLLRNVKIILQFYLTHLRVLSH